MRLIVILCLLLFICSCNSPDKNNVIQKEVSEKTPIKDSVQIIDEIQTEQEKEVLFDCYDGAQQEMNICSYKEYLHYDSILNVRYNSLLEILNDKLIIQSGYQYKFEYEGTKKYINIIIQSEKDWVKLKLSNATVVGQYYEGGSIQPLIVNTQLIIDTKNRIILLEELLENENG